MNYTFLLTKNDYICYSILSLFTQQTNLVLNKDALAQELSLTTYQLNKYFESINTDLALIAGKTPCYIDEPNKVSGRHMD
ncbi:hypothetical protein [Secundilactobacillus odoratitofui]|uniref:hypothetical protein n=1 Tax=Secundilactobacillus odoratitofui TaxID=480930 RepID=UPI0006D0ACE1|nr:hypothetical protein [Secundilactobacillus odoratitofui]